MTRLQYRNVRKLVGTQAEVARALGIDRVTLNRREKGHTRITDEMVRALKDLARERGKA